MSISLLNKGWRDSNLYAIGKFSEEGELLGFCYAGRPSSLRIYDGESELKNGLRYMKSNRSGILKGVKILTGEIVEEAN